MKIQMNFSESGLELLKNLEGFSAKAYNDSGGKKTIGYGHLIVAGDGIVPGEIIEKIQATSLLKKDVQKAVDAINNVVVVGLTQNQFDALVIFVFNVGINAFLDRKSTRLNSSH